MQDTDPGVTRRFSIMLFVFWASVVSVEVFLVPFLVHAGYSSSQAGYVMSTVFLVSIGTGPLWGMVCDRTGRYRLVIITALTISAAVMLMVPLAVAAFPAVLALAALFSMSANSMPAILDSWVVGYTGRNGTANYGVARGFGSLGYAVMSIGVGIIVDRLGLAAMFPTYGVLAVVVILLTFTVREQPLPPGGTSQLNRGGHSLFTAVRSTPEYLWFVVAALGIVTSLRATATFLPLLIYSTGGTNSHVGLSQAVAAASEIPFMMLAARLVRRFPPRRVLAVAMGVFVFRIGLLGYVTTPAAIIAVQVLHGASFGLFLPASVYFINVVAPRNHATVFQTIAPAVYFGVGSVIGSSWGGIVVENRGLTAMYRGAALPVLLFGLLFCGTVAFRRPPVAAPGNQPGAPAPLQTKHLARNEGDDSGKER